MSPVELIIFAAALLITAVLAFLFGKRSTNVSAQQPRALSLSDADLTSAILALDEALRKQQQLETRKSEILAMVTHDLRSPLTSIWSSLEMLQMGVYDELPERANNQVSLVVGDVRRLLGLINDLLDIEKMEAGKLSMDCERVEVLSVLKQCKDSIDGYAASHNVRVELDSPETHVWADKTRLSQVMVNLLSNAIKYSPTNETVSIKAKDAGLFVRFEVIDKGEGISAEDCAKLFERFEQLDPRARHGSGLGLSICKEIVTALGGSIGVESNLGRGTTFWFLLPKEPVQSLIENGEQNVESLSSAVWLARLEDASK